MLKLITLKFEEKIEGFDDTVLANVLIGKKIIRWDAQLIQRKTDHYWTILVEYEPSLPGGTQPLPSKKKKDGYKDLMTEGDWPLFEALREWRGETSRKEGVPSYILFTNVQLAKIATLRPVSLNALQQINGIGKAKRERYGNAVLNILCSFEHPEKREDTNG